MKSKISLASIKVKSFVTEIVNEDFVKGGLRGSSVMPTKEEDREEDTRQVKSEYPHVCPIANPKPINPVERR